MPEKVQRTGIVRDAEWDYFLDDAGDLVRERDGTEEHVATLGFVVADDDLGVYFVDEDGDIARLTLDEYRVEQRLEHVAEEHAVLAAWDERDRESAYAPGESRTWVLGIEDEDRARIVRDTVATWRVPKLPRAFEVGDRVLLAVRGRVVGAGEVGSIDREPDILGDLHVWLLHETGLVDDGAIVSARAGISALTDEQASTLWPQPVEDAQPITVTAPATLPSSADDEPRLFDILAWEPAREKVRKLGLARAPGTILRIIAGDVCELSLSDRPDARGRMPARYLDAPPLGEQSDAYVYFVDCEGDVARLPSDVASLALERASWRGREPLASPIDPPTVELAPGTHTALTLLAPWAWAILHAGKDVENRSWGTAQRGPLLVHASAKPVRGAQLASARQTIARCSGLSLEQVPTEFPRGVIVGVVELVDCATELRSPWGMNAGALEWKLERPRVLAEPVRARGSLNLWRWTVPSPR